MDKIQKQIYNRTYNDKIKEQEKLKKSQLEYGMKQEKEAIVFLNTFFTDLLVKTANQYSKYDFNGLNSGMIYELKSNMYDYNQYKTAVIDTKKLKSYKGILNLIIIFSYLENKTDTEYYYIKFNYDTFMSFPQRTITLKRGYDNIITDIPKYHLIKCDILNPIVNKPKIIEVPFIT